MAIWDRLYKLGQYTYTRKVLLTVTFNFRLRLKGGEWCTFTTPLDPRQGTIPVVSARALKPDFREECRVLLAY